jgi:hypothetical protein
MVRVTRPARVLLSCFVRQHYVDCVLAIFYLHYVESEVVLNTVLSAAALARDGLQFITYDVIIHPPKAVKCVILYVHNPGRYSFLVVGSNSCKK